MAFRVFLSLFATFFLFALPGAVPLVADVLTPDSLSKVNIKRTVDYDQLVELRIIRILVPYSKTFFFFDGATPKGLSYEAVERFEDYVNEREKKGRYKIHAIIIPTARERLFTHLQEGLGDIAIGNLTKTRERSEMVAFSDPYMTGVDEILVTSKEHEPITSLDDLAGRAIHVRKSSSYFEHLEDLNAVLASKKLDPIKIAEIDDHLEDEDVLEMINAGMLERTIVDDHKAEFWAKIFDNIQLHHKATVHSGGEIGWAVRKNSPKLLEVVNGFAKDNKKGTLIGNVVFNRYLKNTRYITNAIDTTNYKRYNNLKDYFIKFGDEYKFDYLLLAALGYQESQLDQTVRSRVGAIGVMQMLPSTAKDKSVNIPNITKVENNIHAGAKYLRYLADVYIPPSESVDNFNRGLLALASYNAGPAKIQRLRSVAAVNGYNPNIWFNNVEIIVAKKVGRETVQYVSNILKYYAGYRMLEEKMKLAAAEKN